MQHLIADLFDRLEPTLRRDGPAILFVVLLFESLGLPLPGESALVLAAIMAARRELALPAVLLWAWAGSVLGDNIGYLIGRRLGRPVILRYGARIGLTAARFARVEAAFARYGPATVAGARFVNVLRQLNGVVAGTAGMHWRTFLIFNALGAALWVAAWGAGTYYLGEHLGAHLFARPSWLSHTVATLLGLALAAAAGLAAWWWHSRRRGPGRP